MMARYSGVEARNEFHDRLFFRGPQSHGPKGDDAAQSRDPLHRVDEERQSSQRDGIPGREPAQGRGQERISCGDWVWGFGPAPVFFRGG